MSSLWARDPLGDNALIVVFQDRRGGLWSSDISRFVEQVEEQVDAGLVSFALTDGRRPSVADALAAARFAGCTSAVLAVVDSGTGDGMGLLPGSLRGMTVSVASCRRNARSVVEVFRAAAGGARAACA